ncbi:MAG: bacteriophage holin [Chlamydiota bacterium]
MKLHPVKLGLAGGVLWGLAVFVVTLISVVTSSMETAGYGKMFLDVLASIYPGFTISVGGSIIGLIYGFIDVFIGLALFAWLYNAFCGCCHHSE